MHTLLPLLLLLLLPGCQSAMDYSIQERGERLQVYIDREFLPDAPGIQYVAVSADSILFSYAGGVASVAPAIPLRENMTMMAYSMTKVITAAAVLQLAEQGALSLDDPVARYLPGLPYPKEVTIRRLLAQTSGIPNPIPLGWVHLAEEHAAFNEEEALRTIVQEHNELDFASGKKYAYSNISYWLLGHVVTMVSGSSYEEYVRTHIFDPLGIPPEEIGFTIPLAQQHSKGYLPKWSFLNLFKSFVIDAKYIGEYESGWLRINDHYLNGPAFGGMVASARAVALFLQDQLHDSSALFSRQTKELFYTEQLNNSGEPVQMTPGWHIGSENGERFYFKEGGGGGFHSEMRLYPARGIATVVIANNTTFDVKGFLSEVDRGFANK